MLIARRVAPIFLSLLLGHAPGAGAWGPDAHVVVFDLSWPRLTPTAQKKLSGLIGTDESGAMAGACNWPDRARSEPLFGQAGPLHYVNLPRGESRYQRARDCPDGRCVTEAIIDSARQLGDDGLTPETRAMSFAWVCHLVADLHQPLHVGYADDRGGNLVAVTLDGERQNLHRWWDTTLLRSRWPDRTALWQALAVSAPRRVSTDWTPDDVIGWTDENRRILMTEAYPPVNGMTDDFIRRSADRAEERLVVAAARLASVLNAVLSEAVVDR